jgi:O-antigen ligase
LSDFPGVQFSVPLATPGPGSRWLTRAALGLVAASWVLPFLQPFHSPPLPSFFSEWLAIVLSLLSLLCLLGDRATTALHWHGSITWALLALAGLIFLQWVAGMVPYGAVALLAMLYLFWAVLVMSAAALLAARLGVARVVRVLAWVLVAAGVVNAGVILTQFLRVPFAIPLLIYPSPDGIYYGNIAQRNHFAHYMALSVASAIYLQSTGKLKAMPGWLCLVFLTFAGAVTASRSWWVYAACFVGLALMRYGTGFRTPERGRVLRLAVGVTAILALWSLFLPRLAVYGYSLETVAERLSQPVEHRPVLWSEAWDMFVTHPVSGVGFGRFGAEHFERQASGDVVMGLATNAHNIMFHFAAETGVVGLCLLAILAWAIFRRLQWRADESERWWMLAMLGVAAAHSMVEFPLWYAYFLGITAFVLGIAAAPAASMAFGPSVRRLVLAALAFTTVNMTWTAVTYSKLESVLTIAGLYSDRAYEALRGSLRDPLLRPHAEWTVATVMPVDEHDLAYKLQLNTRVVNYIPSEVVAYQQAYLLAMAGEVPKAAAQLQKALTAYPHEATNAAADLRRYAGRYPLRFQPLLESARSAAALPAAP